MSTQKGHEVLDDMYEHLVDILSGTMDEEAAIQQALFIRTHFMNHWGGQTIYFKKRDTNTRDKQIYSECNGTNHSELARKYALSVQQVYAIIKQVHQSEMKRIQPKLL